MKSIKERTFYKHESFIDTEEGGQVIIDSFTPINSKTKEVDKSKDEIFLGRTIINVKNEPTPYQFKIPEAKSLDEAICSFEDVLDKALKQTKEQIEEYHKKYQEEMQKEESNK